MSSRQVPSPQIEAEQSHITMLYRHLDEARERAETSLKEAHRSPGVGTARGMVEREMFSGEYARRLARLNGVEHGLCFGRVDDSGGESLYIGRIGLRDGDGEPVLIDWRAPAARPFYTATPGNPGSLVRRRHLHTRNRTVVGVDDEVFDLDRMSDADRRSLVGEAALLATLRRARTGKMSEVVATIQTEQDRVIRSGLHGTLVVQGGPGTGKTVAALHRAAYLLYTHRDVLERRGVLIIGPNDLFSRYIEQVLPSLGESDVVMTTLGRLYPGIAATAEDGPSQAVIKGDLRMAEVMAGAVQDRQRVPEGDLEVKIPARTSVRGGKEVVVDWTTLRVDHGTCVIARDRARALRSPHNEARHVFVLDMLRALATAEAEQYERLTDEEELGVVLPDDGDSWLELPPDEEEMRIDEEETLREACRVLWEQPTVRQAMDELWPILTPEQLVGELLADWEAMLSAGLDAGEAGELLRPPGAPWTVGDVPLLDEAAELLGSDLTGDQERDRANAAERRDEQAYAQDVLTYNNDFEILDEAGARLSDLLDVGTLAERHHDRGPALTTAQRAAADRTWVYGHVILDEAQELSAMAWRSVMRRIPTRSLTVVGDIAQTGSAAGARTWEEVLAPYAEDRWREERLMINYRTPAEIMDVAADVLRAVAPDQVPPQSVRTGETPPRAIRQTPLGFADVVESELTAIGEGRLAVIVPDARHTGFAEVDLEAPVVVLTVTQSKGLEFDAVVVVAPDEILAQSPKGGHDLYVAITRATRRLAVVHEAELPDMLAKLAR
jgi:DNA helicase IV